jgi:hypothetical protein
MRNEIPILNARFNHTFAGEVRTGILIVAIPHSAFRMTTMPDAFAFDIPELNRIESMMEDLLPAGPANATAERAGRPARRRKSAPRRRLHGWSLRQFAEGANLTNAAGFRSALTAESGAARTRLGAVTLGKYAESVNWANAHDGPQLVLIAAPAPAGPSGPQDTVEGFFEVLNWE